MTITTFARETVRLALLGVLTLLWVAYLTGKRIMG